MSSLRAAPVRFDPYAYCTHEDPFPVYHTLRHRAPVYRDPDRGFFALSRYDDVHAALRDWETFTSSRGITLEETTELSPPMLIEMDPPRHTELRGLVSRAFTPKRVAAMEDPVRLLARRLARDLARRGGGDVIAEFAAVVPMAVISEMLGVPPSDRGRIQELAHTLVHREPGRAELTRAGARAGVELASYFARLVGDRRGGHGDDLVTGMLHAEEGGRRLRDEEVIGFCFLLIIAGYETTTKLIGNACFWLSRHRDQLAAIAAEPDLVPAAVEETLRYDGPTQLMAREATRDAVIRDGRIPAGARVLLLLGSANRDEARFREPDRFDVFREPVPHLAFGFGPHHCLGAALARLEGRVALEELLAALPGLVVDEDGAERVHSGNVRGFARLPVRA